MKLISFTWFSRLMLMLLALLMFLAFQSCRRKPRLDPIADVPDLPKDTVYVPKVVSRCNYQYLAADPKKAKKQLDEAVRQLDLLIAEYDGIIQAKSAKASKQIRKIKQLERDEENYN